MNSNAATDDVRLPGSPPVRMEPGLTDSRAQSPTSSDNDGSEVHAQELWDELLDVLQAQQDEFVEQDETALPVAPGPLFDTPATHVVKTQRTIVAGKSAKVNLARESPSQRFFACPDQIDALGMPKTWIHGQVISTLGDAFCISSRSKPRHEHYDILPTDLFETWNSYMGGHRASRTTLSFHFKQAASPLECGAWLVPVLLESHWYLLELDWVDSELRIYDSLATSTVPHSSLVKFGDALVGLITEDLKLEDSDWDMVPEHVSGFHCGLTRF